MIFPDMIPGPDVEDTPDCHRCGELSMTLELLCHGWVTHQQRVPMAFLAFRESQAKPTMLTHKLNKHKFIGKEKRK